MRLWLLSDVLKGQERLRLFASQSGEREGREVDIEGGRDYTWRQINWDLLRILKCNGEIYEQVIGFPSGENTSIGSPNIYITSITKTPSVPYY